MNSTKIKNWIPVIIIIAIGIFIRWNNNFRWEILPGINGGYYPFQIKTILKTGFLGFADMPLVLYFEAFLAQIIMLFSPANANNSMLLASKMSDAIIPALLPIPIFLFASQVFKTIENRKTYAYVLSAFSLIYVPFIIITASDFHKNAVGFLMIALCLLFLYKYLMYKQKSQLALTISFFALTLLTHIGSFGTILMLAIVFVFQYLLSNKNNLLIHKRNILIGIAILLSVLAVLLLLDTKRFIRLTTFIAKPLTFFENPLILFLLDNQPVVNGLELVNLLVCNLLAIGGLIYLVIRKSRLHSTEKGFVFSLAITSLILCSPIIGIEWSNRFTWIAPIFIIIEYLFIFRIMNKRFFRIALVTFFILVGIYSIRPAMTGKRPNISNEAYHELYQIKNQVAFNSNSIILTRHGLEWHTGFVTEQAVGQDYSLTQSEFDKYNAVYVLTQHQGYNIKDMGWSHFNEVEVPNDAIEEFSGEHLKLFKITKPLNYTKAISEPSDTFGTITKIENQTIYIANTVYKYAIELKPATKIITKQKNTKLAEGMKIEVWGDRKAFSLGIIANTIHEIKH